MRDASPGGRSASGPAAQSVTDPILNGKRAVVFGAGGGSSRLRSLDDDDRDRLERFSGGRLGLTPTTRMYGSAALAVAYGWPAPSPASSQVSAAGSCAFHHSES
jgi:hypothetical protein